MNDDELLAISQELLPKQHLKKKLTPIRCSYIIYDNVNISFGKIASSNNELTFKIAHKDDTYLHIKDYFERTKFLFAQKKRVISQISHYQTSFCPANMREPCISTCRAREQEECIPTLYR